MSLRMDTSSTLRIEQCRRRGLTLYAPKVVQYERKPGRRTVTWEEVHEWQRDNKYIRRGYRPGTANLPDLFASMTFLHNETCNVYTHLIGAILMPLLAPIYMRVLSDARLSTVTTGDYLMFGLFFGTAECCLVLSTLYHLNMSHSSAGEQFWLRMDLLGIILVTEGTQISGIKYIFPCEPRWQKTHWATVCLPVSPFFVSYDVRVAISSHGL